MQLRVLVLLVVSLMAASSSNRKPSRRHPRPVVDRDDPIIDEELLPSRQDQEALLRAAMLRDAATDWLTLPFAPASPSDPFVQMTATNFVDDYQTKLAFHFATIETNRIVTAEIATHNVSLEEVAFEPETGVIAIQDDAMSKGYTYRVNLLLALHFNSKHFGGTKYFTVASADYTCKNDTLVGEKCEPESFLQNPRRTESVDAIPSYVRAIMNDTIYHGLPFNFTAYETQELTTHGDPDAKMHYAAFKVDDEPVPCMASIYFDGKKAHVLHYNTDCMTVHYDAALWRASARNDYLKVVGISAAVVTILAALGVFFGRRLLTAHQARYNSVRFQKHGGGGGGPVQECDNVPKPETTPRDLSKSYNSMAV
ncbi:Aste57867_20079 [Aphanomyces stellatus]|uniref:Aste57867_20079 protein n=1 Tax=Aphanomyces stellatus TaxID=120398 RepID=A0A485LIT2_9STRA|nr:hypothetical protein As57867_020013 [Aphanomyces stellatus]VFT96774.1 Aste57867_20079 [Aphanomyces stellatus]